MRRRNIKKPSAAVDADYSNIDQTQRHLAFTSRRLLERRRRKKKNKGGHDPNGYDDGSWRGDDGNYGSEQEHGYDDKHSKHNRPSKESGDYGDTSGDADEYDDADQTYPDDNEAASRESPSGHGETDSPFKPYTEKAKYKTGSYLNSDDPYASAQTSWRAPGSASAQDAEDTDADDLLNKWSLRPSKDSHNKAKYLDELDDKNSEHSYVSTTDDSSSDCASLKTFFDDMGGNEWIDSTGWTSATSRSNTCCRAFGVSCNAAGRVTALDLGANGLSGPLLPALFELRYLTR
ncbi:hypothetical protein P389DRAFT_209465, partial [Cystobasidium minutum MCA 4210]|uniref:uncharacterized protein n=1 Tax=Cystobasidium minutum MCA 4210 TaxID=1397322 RepID=UPI0034CF88B8|eukprot:jgi/Rhomi1/209465/estExt_Genemark1.C_3_t10061